MYRPREGLTRFLKIGNGVADLGLGRIGAREHKMSREEVPWTAPIGHQSVGQLINHP